MKNNSYIVTGASGLIGGAVVRELNARGADRILAVDHLGTGEKWKNLRDLQISDYLERDVFRARMPELVQRGIAGVFHLGACSSTTERDATYLSDNNFNFTKELALLCQMNGVPMYYASSAATYGGGEQGYSDDENGIFKLRPLNMYGYSKQLFDVWAMRRELFRDSCVAGMKFTNVFGPNEKHKGPMRSMVLRSFEQIMETGKVKLFKSCRPEYADGEQKRDFIYVKDAAKMVVALYEKRARGLYNIGSGRAETWNELVKAAFRALKKKPRIEYVDMPEELRGKYQYYTCADMTKFNALQTGTGASPLKDTVADYIRSHLLPEYNEDK